MRAKVELHFDSILSQRHTPITEDDALLDAARECVLAVGVRRTTLTDVARRAGVSRMTLYRRYPDLEGVLASLMTREFGRLVADAAARAGGATTRERVVAMVVHGSRALAEDPLFERLLDVDPELLLPYVTQRLGGMQKMAVAAGARRAGRRRRLGADRRAARGPVRRGRADRARLRAGLPRRARARPVGGARPRDRRVPAAMSASLNCRPPRRRARTARRRRGRSTSSWSAAGSRAPGSRSTPPAAASRSRCSSAATSRTARRRWSSKLVHGGLRYLEHGDVGLA